MVLLTSEEVTNARKNIDRYEWSRADRDSLLERCKPWMEKSDEELWNMVTGQAVPRGIHVNEDLGCPKCGRDVYRFGNYPWILSPDRPFKIECPSCGAIWPENDFAAFHKSGLGENGVFHPELADRSLLKAFEDEMYNNGMCIDDGLGWVDNDGNRWWFVAYYSHYGTWTWLPDAALDLATAWIYTGNQVYAHKAAVILDRTADVYPEMDIAPYSQMGLYNSHGMTGRGRIQGCIWETFISEKMARAWDMVSDTLAPDRDLIRFLASKSEQWKLKNDKGSPENIRSNIHNGLLREVILSCKDLRISGNEGMTQTAMAVAAAVLDDPVETPAAIEWLFTPGSRSKGGGGHISQVLIGDVDRDGFGNEASPGYSFIWLNLFRRCAEVLERCRKHHAHDLHVDYPRLRRMYAAPYRLTVLDRFTPHIGDTQKTGNPEMISVDLDTIIDGFIRFDDPWFAKVAYRLNGNTTEDLHTTVYDADPEAIQSHIAKAVDARPIELQSDNLNGYGLSLLRAGRGENARGAWLYYGRSTGHGHRDRLNFGLYYHGMNVIPDLGYPEYADSKWPKRAGWTRNTVSHNTVVVDGRGQNENWVGHCGFFATSAGITVVDVESLEVYPNIDEFRRTLAFIDFSDEDSYLVDFFRVEGGSDHVMSFHAGEGAASAPELTWHEQRAGTYAGEEITTGDHHDGPPDGRYKGSGFSYLTDVERSTTPNPGWWADWDLVDTWSVRSDGDPLHLRYHVLSTVDEASMAWGEPSRNKPGNPEKLRYLLLRNSKSRSLYAAAIEVYKGDENHIREASRIDLGLSSDSLEATALKIRGKSMLSDVILSANDPGKMYDLGDGICVAAKFAVVRNSMSCVTRRDECYADEKATGKQWHIFALGGSCIKLPDGTLAIDETEYTGVVRDFCREDVGQVWVDIEGNLPAGIRLRGSQLRIHNDGQRDACYTIRSVSQPVDGISRVDLEDTSFVQGLGEDEMFIYNIDIGDSCDVQTIVHIDLVNGKAQEIRSTVDWHFEAQPGK